eukprot:4057663-Pyramimonas_sp.AAC.1
MPETNARGIEATAASQTSVGLALSSFQFRARKWDGSLKRNALSCRRTRLVVPQGAVVCKGEGSKRRWKEEHRGTRLLKC